MNRQLTTHSELETISAGKEFSELIRSRTVVALSGDLGAGKTRFIKGVCEGLGVTEHVASPTFTIVNEYQGRSLKIFHFDFYRINSAAELQEIGFEEYVQAGGVCLIEWANRVKEILPDQRIDMTFSLGKDENERIIIINEVKPE
ncbi:MAG: tRNA (adenosine(37)-N6)-threonylcarbamoyltransferase complex ATPase subunit type 1 TsaE [Ignavibacteriales bacterium]|nr:tRNA (adenosine(37)-N6)-threonylcarbamoyltransferase complex ATPase subunit type 1 TsaE [Ignavibacteriales bacterium]